MGGVDNGERIVIVITMEFQSWKVPTREAVDDKWYLCNGDLFGVSPGLGRSMRHKLNAIRRARA